MALLAVAVLGACSSRPRPAIVFDDVERFFSVLTAHAGAPDADVLRREYFERGSPGLTEFVRQRIGTAEALEKTIRSRRRYFETLRTQLADLPAVRPRVERAFRELQRIYPAATLPPVYFVVGRLTSGGISTDTGLIIGVEMYGAGPNVPTGELNAWERSVIKPLREIPGIVAHELIHYQQPPAKKQTLLAQAMREGSADFVGELISGENINRHLIPYGQAHEAELWTEFKAAMHGNDVSRWLYNGVSSDDRPADLGYWIGYQITRAYYLRAADKSQAIRDILTVTDYADFLRRSGYAEQF